MINYLIAAIFILTIAITLGGILVTTHLRTTYKTEFISALLFFQVFYFTFGFYAMWGQFIMTSFLSSIVTSDLLSRITDLIVLLGLPFLALALMMFVRFSREVAGGKTTRFFILWFIIINTLLIFGIGYVFVEFKLIDTFLVVKYYYILFNLLFIAYGVIIMLSTNKLHKRLHPADIRNISLGILLLMVIQSILLILYRENIYLALIFILIFYISGSFLPIYLRYRADLSVLIPESEISKSFEEFCKKYEISKRETEIIFEICRGLTNQQIADKLFISLQTVKDHTSRIYFKTNCANRAQLIRMVNEDV